jgi:hypothetical protein
VVRFGIGIAILVMSKNIQIAIMAGLGSEVTENNNHVFDGIYSCTTWKVNFPRFIDQISVSRMPFMNPRAVAYF